MANTSNTPNFKKFHLFFGDKHQWTDLLLYQRLPKAQEENFAPLILFHVQYETFHDSLLSYEIKSKPVNPQRFDVVLLELSKWTR